LPGWLACTVQVPAALSVAVTPETVQMTGVVEAKLTARPEVAVAERETDAPAVWVGIVAKVMLWDCGPWFCGDDELPQPARSAAQNSAALHARKRASHSDAAALFYAIADSPLSCCFARVTSG